MNNHELYFDDTETNRLFNIWLNNHPDSFHPLDLDRWASFVKESLDKKEDVEYSVIKKGLSDYNHRDDDERIADAYFSKYLAMRDLYKLITSQDTDLGVGIFDDMDSVFDESWKSDWKVSDDGTMNYIHHTYTIEGRRLTEQNWLEQIKEKDMNFAKFYDAYKYALSLIGEKQLIVELA